MKSGIICILACIAFSCNMDQHYEGNMNIAKAMREKMVLLDDNPYKYYADFRYRFLRQTSNMEDGEIHSVLSAGDDVYIQYGNHLTCYRGSGRNEFSVKDVVSFDIDTSRSCLYVLDKKNELVMYDRQGHLVSPLDIRMNKCANSIRLLNDSILFIGYNTVLGMQFDLYNLHLGEISYSYGEDLPFVNFVQDKYVYQEGKKNIRIPLFTYFRDNDRLIVKYLFSNVIYGIQNDSVTKLDSLSMEIFQPSHVDEGIKKNRLYVRNLWKSNKFYCFQYYANKAEGGLESIAMFDSVKNVHDAAIHCSIGGQLAQVSGGFNLYPYQWEKTIVGLAHYDPAKIKPWFLRDTVYAPDSLLNGAQIGDIFLTNVVLK